MRKMQRKMLNVRCVGGRDDSVEAGIYRYRGSGSSSHGSSVGVTVILRSVLPDYLAQHLESTLKRKTWVNKFAARILYRVNEKVHLTQRILFEMQQKK